MKALVFVFDALVIVYHTPLIPYLKYRFGLSSEAATYENSTFGNLVLVISLQFLTKVFACGLLCFFNFMALRELSSIISQYIWTSEQLFHFFFVLLRNRKNNIPSGRREKSWSRIKL